MDVKQIEKLSASLEEPTWVLERRLDAWKWFESMELPKEKDEPWRYTDFRRLRFKLEDFAHAAPGAGTDVEKPSIEARGRAGFLVQRDATVIESRLDPELVKQGVIYCSLDQAIKEHPDLVQQHLFSQILPESGYFRALNAAFFTGGSFLYVPEGVHIQQPIETQIWVDTGGSIVSPHSLVIVEDGASLEYFTRLRSGDLQEPSFANSASESVIGGGSQIKTVTLQEFGPHVWHFETQRATVGPKVESRHLVITLGGKFSREEVETNMAGERAEVEMLAVYFAEKGQHFDFRTLQNHAALNCRSDLLYKGALKDESRAVYSGMIRVEEAAAGTDAYQANRNLVLSDHAKADSKPELEILNNDVRCTHGASVSQINSDEVFYLESRGIPKKEAQRLIVNGFFEEVVDRIKIDEIREELMQAVQLKLEGVLS